jgi:hypothetical protein
MHQLRLVDNDSPPVRWRETDFAEEIPSVALSALAAYYPLARCPDRLAVEQWIASEPGLSGPHCAVFQLAEDGIEMIRQGSEVCSGAAAALARIIEQDILGKEDGARRYEIQTDDLRDATVLPLLQNARLCLAVVI